MSPCIPQKLFEISMLSGWSMLRMVTSAFIILTPRLPRCMRPSESGLDEGQEGSAKYALSMISWAGFST